MKPYTYLEGPLRKAAEKQLEGYIAATGYLYSKGDPKDLVPAMVEIDGFVFFPDPMSDSSGLIFYKKVDSQNSCSVK